MTENRINARVGEVTKRQVEELVQSTGLSTSDVVREAIAVYHAQVRKERPIPKRLLAMVGKGRSPDGRTDVASNHKQVLTESLSQKHKLAPQPKPMRKKA